MESTVENFDINRWNVTMDETFELIAELKNGVNESLVILDSMQENNEEILSLIREMIDYSRI